MGVHDGAKHHEKDGVEVLNLKVVHNWSDHKIDTDDQDEDWDQNWTFVRPCKFRFFVAENQKCRHCHAIEYPNSETKEVYQSLYTARPNHAQSNHSMEEYGGCQLQFFDMNNR